MEETKWHDDLETLEQLFSRPFAIGARMRKAKREGRGKGLTVSGV